MVAKADPFGKGTEETKEKAEEGAAVEKEKERKTLSEDGSPSEQLPFEKVEIHVEGEAVKEIPKIPAGAFDGAGAEGEQEGEGEDKGTGEIPDDISLDSLKGLINSGVNIPSLYAGTWWIRTPEQTDIFATELYYYCQKKGINLRDWIFDEFALLLAGINLAGGIYKDYQTHIAEEKKKKEEETEE